MFVTSLRDYIFNAEAVQYEISHTDRASEKLCAINISSIATKAQSKELLSKEKFVASKLIQTRRS